MKPIRIKTAQSKRAWMALACEQGRVIEAQRRQLDVQRLPHLLAAQGLGVAMGPQWVNNPDDLRKWRRIREEGRDRSWARRAEERQERVAEVLAVLRGVA